MRAIITQPGSQAANVGNNVALQVSAAGTSLTYQWYFNSGAGGDQPLSGATAPLLTLMNVQAGLAGTYSVRVANALGMVTSSGAALTVSAVGSGDAPVITGQPQSVTSACEGYGFSFGVTATGPSPLSANRHLATF
jgi:phage-related tail protein